jgi:hypothetical protein
MTPEKANELNREYAIENGNQLAFPIDESIPHHRGLTKREYMATQLMVGLLSNGYGVDSSIEQSIIAVDKLLIKLNERL